MQGKDTEIMVNVFIFARGYGTIKNKHGRKVSACDGEGRQSGVDP